MNGISFGFRACVVLAIAGAATALGAGLGACGSSSSDTGGGDASAADALAEAADAPVDRNFVTPPDSGPDGPITQNEFLLWSSVQRPFAGPGTTTLAFRNYVVPPGGVCSTQTISGCIVIDCPAPPQSGASAGVVALTSDASTLLSIDPSAAGTYAPTSAVSTSLWQAGDSLAFSGTGDVVPTFVAKLTAPSQITWLTPARDGGALAIDRSQDLVVTWTPASESAVVVLSAEPSATSFVRAVCPFDGDAGTATIPAALVAKVPTGLGKLEVGGQATTDVDAGGYTIHVALIQSSITVAQYQ